MQKLLLSFKNACTGLKYCFLTQRNMVIHTLIGVVVVATAFLLRINLTGMLFLLTAITVVMVTEVLNSALEQAIDLFSKERSDLAQKAKDIAAGAVLLTSLYAVIVGLCVLGPPLWTLAGSVLPF